MEKDFTVRGSNLLAVMAIRFKLAKILCIGIIRWQWTCLNRGIP